MQFTHYTAPNCCEYTWQHLIMVKLRYPDVIQWKFWESQSTNAICIQMHLYKYHWELNRTLKTKINSYNNPHIYIHLKYLIYSSENIRYFNNWGIKGGLRLTPLLKGTFHLINRNPLRFTGDFFLFKSLKRLTPTVSGN